MLVTIREFPDALALRLKLLTQTQVASKAVLMACQSFAPHRLQIRDLEEQIKVLEQRNLVLSQTLDRAREAALVLVAKTSQPDLIDG